jgi:MSHA biogenesis protein MshK
VAHRLTTAGAALLASLNAVCLAAAPEPAADPTRPPAEVGAGSPTSASSTGPVLQSVIVGRGRRPAAIIGGQRVELGGSFGDAILIRVSETEVQLRGPAGLLVLRMTPEAVKRPLRSARPPSRGSAAAANLLTKP